MAIWGQRKSRTQTMSEQLTTKKEQYRNKEFAAGSMAMCALLSAADGSTERRKTAALIASNETLAIFPPAELQQKFDWYCDKLSKDYDFGKVEAIVTIGKLKAKPEQARAAISIGVIIGAADGDFDADERQAVKEACFAVGIAPSEFDL